MSVGNLINYLKSKKKKKKVWKCILSIIVMGFHGEVGLVTTVMWPPDCQEMLQCEAQH